MSFSNHALSFDYPAGSVEVRCSCGWVARAATNAAAITAHNAHLVARVGVGAGRTYV